MSSKCTIPLSIENRDCMSVRNDSYDWILTVPFEKPARPTYFVATGGR